jgi:hypothetical protein
MTSEHDHFWTADPAKAGQLVCAGCGEIDQTGGNPFEGARELAPQGAALAIPDAAQIAMLLDAKALPVVQWAGALLQRTEYEEDAGSDPGLDIVAAILGAETSVEVLAATSMRTVNDFIGTEPGAHSPLLRIHGAKPLASTFEEGPSCFAVIDCEIVAGGERFKLTCGARAVQAAILAHVYRGWLPFECILTRRLKPTRKGFYPLNLEAGG